MNIHNPLASLRARLALWLLLPLSIFVAACTYFAWRHAATVADYVQDRDLLASAKMLADRLIWENDDVSASIPPAALTLFASGEHDQVFLSVRTAEGEVLAGTADFPVPDQLRLTGADRAQWYDTEFRGLHLRAVTTERPMYADGGTRHIVISVGKTENSRDRMFSSLWLPSVEYLLIALVLAVVATVVALTWELRQLTWLNRQLAAHDPMHIQDVVIDARSLHTELRPIADTVNTVARRLRAHLLAQRRFIADAAHQLRTPLALQSSQIEFARDACARGADTTRVLQALQDSNRQLVNITNKLLLLAQAEDRDAASATLAPVDLSAAALRVMEQLAALAERRRIDLGMDAPAAAILVHAQPTLLDALLANLLDNALRYTPEGGRVTVGVRNVDGTAELTVDDNGPGIPPEARERVFERFYRLASDIEGTGLGLAIVREIAHSFGATVTLSSNPTETSGLRATVRFTAAH